MTVNFAKVSETGVNKIRVWFEGEGKKYLVGGDFFVKFAP